MNPILQERENMERQGRNRIPVEEMAPREILERGLRIKRLEEIQVSSLHLDGAITDRGHIDELKGMIKDEGGLIIPLGVCAFLDEKGKVFYEIFDGYHRGAALKELGWPRADAKVLYGRTREELYDLRVVSASSVRSVSFSRLVIWMQSSFEETEWYNEHDLSLAQVLSLALQDSSGQRLGLSPEEAEGAKAWAQEKARRWGKNVAVLYPIMLAVENSSLEIVKMVRINPGGGKDGKGVLNPARFMAMVSELPGDISGQKFVVKLIIDHNLLKDETAAVARALATAQDRNQMKARLKANPRSVLGRGIETSAPEVDDQLEEIRYRQPITSRAGNGGYGIRGKQIVSSGEAESLRTALEVINEQQALLLNGHIEPYWWTTFSGFSENERQVLAEAFGKGIPLEEIATSMGKTIVQVASLIASAHRKYVLFLDDVRLKKRMRQITAEIKITSRRQGKKTG